VFHSIDGVGQNPLKALVLGATGFIGGHIAKVARQAGWDIRGLRRDEASIGHVSNLDIAWFQGDLDAPDSLKQAFDGVQIVFHAAGYYPTNKERRSLVQQITLAQDQIETLIEIASQARIARFIYTSSLSTIGFPPPASNRLADENDYYQPGDLKGSAYYEAKYIMESILLKAASQGFPAVILNPTAVFGPGDVHLSLGRLLLAAAHGRLFAWLPGIVNVVDVRDVAAAHLQAVNHGNIGERYILGGHNLTIHEALLRVSRIAGVSPPRFEVPKWLIEAAIKMDNLIPQVNLTGNHLQAMIRWQGFDSSKAITHLGLTNRPFSETIQDALDWFVENEYLQTTAD